MIHRGTKIFAVIGGLFFLGGIGLCVYFFNNLSEKKVVYAEQRKNQAELEARSAQLATLSQKLEETNEHRKRLATRVLEDAQVIDFLGLIETLGNEQGVTLKTDTLRVEEAEAPFEYLVMRMSIEGNYDAVMHTFKIFEVLPYRSMVSNVSLRRSEGDKGEDVWRGECSLRVLKFKNV